MPIIVSEADLKARRKRRWKTSLTAGLILVTLILGITFLTSFLNAWNDNPMPIPDDQWQSGMLQLVGDCCHTSDESGALHLSSMDKDEVPWVRISVGELGGRNKIENHKVSFDYTISRKDFPAHSKVSIDTSEEKEYYEQGLRVGDTVTHGPVTITILTIREATFDRNNAVTIHVTFDENRLSEAP